MSLGKQARTLSKGQVEAVLGYLAIRRPCGGCWIPAEGNAATTPPQPPRQLEQPHPVLFYLSHAFGSILFPSRGCAPTDNVLVSGHSSDVGLWQILLQKSF